MIGERRDRGVGPPPAEGGLPDIRRCLGNRRSSSRPESQGAFGATGGSPQTRPRGSPDRSGQGAKTGASTKRASSPGDRRQIASRTDVPEALDARGRSFAKRMHSGASGGRSPSRPVSRAAPVRPLGARRSVVGRAAPPGSVRRRPRGPRPVVPRIRRISGFS